MKKNAYLLVFCASSLVQLASTPVFGGVIEIKETILHIDSLDAKPVKNFGWRLTINGANWGFTGEGLLNLIGWNLQKDLVNQFFYTNEQGDAVIPAHKYHYASLFWDRNSLEVAIDPDGSFYDPGCPPSMPMFVDIGPLYNCGIITGSPGNGTLEQMPTRASCRLSKTAEEIASAIANPPPHACPQRQGD